MRKYFTTLIFSGPILFLSAILYHGALLACFRHSGKNIPMRGAIYVPMALGAIFFAAVAHIPSSLERTPEVGALAAFTVELLVQSVSTGLQWLLLKALKYSYAFGCFLILTYWGALLDLVSGLLFSAETLKLVNQGLFVWTLLICIWVIPKLRKEATARGIC